MKNREELYKDITNILSEMFEIPLEKIKGDSKLYEELDLDSIDAVDLVIRLQELTKKKFDPESFKSIRTVDDIVDAACNILKVTPDPSAKGTGNNAARRPFFRRSQKVLSKSRLRATHRPNFPCRPFLICQPFHGVIAILLLIAPSKCTIAYPCSF